MIAVIPTDESLGAQVRVEEALAAAGLEGASVEPGDASDLEDLEHLKWTFGKFEDANPEKMLEAWEDLAEDLLKLEDPLPGHIEDRLRKLMDESKNTRRELP